MNEDIRNGIIELIDQLSIQIYLDSFSEMRLCRENLSVPKNNTFNLSLFTGSSQYRRFVTKWLMDKLNFLHKNRQFE